MHTLLNMPPRASVLLCDGEVRDEIQLSWWKVPSFGAVRQLREKGTNTHPPGSSVDKKISTVPEAVSSYSSRGVKQ